MSMANYKLSACAKNLDSLVSMPIHESIDYREGH